MAPILFMLFMALAARLEARKDAQDIAANKHIDHVSGWLERAGFSIVLIILFTFICGSWWWVPGGGLIAYGTFTPLFRYWLNAARGLEYHYVSLSSIYDTVFIELAGTKAGQLAYAVEVIALAAGVYITTI